MGLQKALDEKVAARAAVQAVNEELKAIENRNADCAEALADLESTIASERASLTAELKIAKDTMTLEKTNATNDLAAVKDKGQSAIGGYTGMKNRAIAAEADKVALKGEIA